MQRNVVVEVSILLILVGAVLPIGLALHLASVRTDAIENASLADVAVREQEYAQIILTEAADTLRYFAVLPVIPCSPEHIDQMRTATVRTHKVDEIGYFEHYILKCSSWGFPEKVISLSPEHTILSNGMQLRVNARSSASPNTPMVDIYYRDHNVLIEPGRFSNFTRPPDTQIALLTRTGQQIAGNYTPDADTLAKLLSGPPTGVLNEQRYAIAQSPDFTAVVVKPYNSFTGQLRREQMLLVPLGIIPALAIAGVIIWLSRRRLSLSGELAIAIERKEFFVHYQPIIELRTGRCVGAEALVRWRRPDGRLVPPNLFIPVAEETGRISAITEQVFQCVIQDLGNALVEHRGMHIAINLSAQDMDNNRALVYLHHLLAPTEIQADQIWLEATERGFMNVSAATDVIRQARDLGHRVAIDDFGTGYSSLAYLQQLPLDALKIDKAFIDTIGTDSATSRVTDHIISMAKALNLMIVAEGVEHQTQADYLAANHVDYVQGWLYAKALPAEDFVAFYRDHADSAPAAPHIAPTTDLQRLSDEI